MAPIRAPFLASTGEPFQTGTAAYFAVSWPTDGFDQYNVTVEFKIGSNKQTFTRTSSASFAFTVPTSWIPNAMSATMTATIKTTHKTDGIVGWSITRSYTVFVPSSIVPTATATLTRVNGVVPSGWGVYVQGKSKVTVAGGGSSSGATIKKVKIKVGTVTRELVAATFTSTFELPNASPSYPVTVTVEDSRGRTASTTQNIAVIAYTPPTLTSTSVWRANSGGTKTDNGTYGAFKALAGFASVSGKNSISYASSYKEIPSGATVNIGTWVSNTNKVFGSGGLATTKSYLVTITITDALGVAKSWSGVVPSERIPISFLAGGNGVAIGKAATNANWLEIALGTRIQDGTVTHEITGAGIHSASPTGDQPFHQVSTSTDVEPSFRLVRNGNNYGRVYQTITSGIGTLALEAGDRNTETPARMYLRKDGRSGIVPPDGVWRYTAWGMWAGRFDMTGLTQNTYKTMNITFPVGVFSVPVVNVMADTSVPHLVDCSANNITESGCTLSIRRTDTAASTMVHVIVMQYAP